MKKADPFSGIPAVPNSLAGQWLAFNHMANHYRKLLNVKPRVDSSAPRMTSAGMTKVSSLSSYLQGPTKTKKATASNKNLMNETAKAFFKTKTLTKQEYSVSTGDTDSFSIESSPINPVTNKRRLVNKSIKAKPQQIYDSNIQGIDYQVVFGPSSIKSSTDAIGSDCDSQPEKPKVELMGVAEKIKVFLDQLHQNEHRLRSSANVNTQTSKQLKKPLKPKLKPKLETDENENPPNPRISRHSNCFLPISSVPNSPKKVIPKKNQQSNPTSVAINQSNKKLLSDAINNAKLTKSRMDNVINNTKSSIGKSEGRGMKSILVKADKQRYISGGSIGSVGTIRGSDDLVTDDILILPLPHSHNEDILLASPKPLKTLVNSKTHKQQKSKTVVVLKNKNRGSSAGYCSQSLSGKANSLSSLGIINNNDSSRDSAYGFSSGESRIESTRESTPEKVRASSTSHSHHKVKSKKISDKNAASKYKSKLSTGAFSVNNPDSIPHGERDNQMGYQRKKGMRNEQKVNENEDKYLNFLTEVTQDIVNRGIYTNKGLKVLFQAHINNHTNLDFNKMEEMLDQLRTDLGIPKDDILNKMEFGYGSILLTNKSPSFTHTSKPKSTFNEEIYGEPDFEYDENPTLHSLTRKAEKIHLSDEESHHPQFSSSNNVFQEKSGKKSARNLPSEDSLSETDIKLSLKEVGIDSETTLEIVETIHKTNRRKYKRESDDSNYDQPTRLNKSSTSRRNRETEIRHKTTSRSVSPSTESS